LSYPELDRLYKVLKNNPELYVEVAGHTDSIGDNEANLKLSQLRADAIKNYLVNKGIDPKRFFTVGYGEEFPIAPNTTEEGRKQNRRTEIVIIENPKDRKLLAKEDGYYYKLQRKRQLEEEIERQRLENERLARKRAEEEKVCLGLEELSKNTFRITFESGKYVLSDSVVQQINSIIASLRCPKKYVLTVAGHADSIGKAENNLKLSKFRATVTRDYLISQGIDKNKIKAVGYGEVQPFTSNSSPAGRRLNRRVEFILNLKK
jgi:outer membrane protein OmpA-like peptidoglycan-associated protein